MATAMPLRLLLLEDRPEDAELIIIHLHQAGFAPEWQCVDTEQDYLVHLNPTLDIILSDHLMPQFDSVRALRLLQERGWDIPFIIVSGSIGEDAAVAAMKHGASDYLLKDRLARLGEAVRQALSQKQLRAEQRQAVQALRESEERFRTVIEQGMDIIAIAEVDGTLRYVSPSVERVLGYASGELQGQAGFVYLNRADLEQGASMPQPGSVVRNEFRVRHKDGSTRVLEAVISNQLENSCISGYVINARDITDRKQAEQALDDERKLLRTLIDAVPDYIYVKDLEGQFILNNSANVELLNVSSAEEAVGKTDLDFFPRGLAERFRYDDRQVLESGQPLVNKEELSVDAAGFERWVLTTKVPLRDHEGRITGTIGVTRDITERKRAEAEMLNAALLRAELEKEKELIELREHFISMVSHDFRTPLAVIQTTSDLLGRYHERISTEQRLKCVHDMQVQIKYMLELLDDVLLVDRARAGKLRSEIAAVDLTSFCRDILDLLQLTDLGGHRFVFLHNGDLKAVATDENLLRRILINLLSNAIKYSPAGSEIQFEVAAPNDELQIRVSDEGIGIPVEDQERLFEIFHRGSNTGRIGGTGLGLPIVKSSIDALGGTIDYESTEGKGTTFWVRIPVGRDHSERS